jgi:pimeloyl-ACP methyl ester carboxylesterase
MNIVERARRVRSPDDDGARVWYRGRCPRDASSTRGVTMFVNGLSNACFQLTPFADAALARGRAVVEWDMRGHGESDDPSSYATVSARSFAKDAWAVIDDFVGSEAGAARDVDVVAYSYGTQIALEMIRARPRRVRAFISLLGTPERILDGLLPATVANATIFTATRVFGERASSFVVGAALKLAATAPMVIWALGRATGYLGSQYLAFRPFFKHLWRLDARTWFRCVVDGHERGSADVFADANRSWYAALIEGDRDFAAPQRVIRSWERYADFFILLPGVAHDGPTSHREEMTAILHDVYDRADRKFSSTSRRRDGD